MKETVLIVEDEPLQRLTLRDMCEEMGYDVLEAEQGEEALYLLEEHPHIAAVMSDLSMPVMDGKEFVQAMRLRFPDVPVAILTISRDLEDVVEVMRLGAQDFIPKPIEQERLKVTLRNMIERRTLHQEITRLRRKEHASVRFKDVIGYHGSLKAVCELGEKMAQSDLPVLIAGETGVGKEEIAQAIHGESRRQGRPFVSINCHAVPDYLAEGLLFGEADHQRLGKCREAQGGTLFINGVEALSLPIQTKLLRLIQEGKMEPAGSKESSAVDLRLIVATNANLKELVAEGGFNENLYFRLASLRIDVPPLRERLDDIEELASHFVRRIAAIEGKAVKAVSLEALKWMQHYRWPGNVREMENLLSGAYFIADHMVISDKELRLLCESDKEEVLEVNSDGMVQLTRADGRLKTLERVQDEAIAYALNYHNQNVTKAAESLHIGRSTLFKRLREKQQSSAA